MLPFGPNEDKGPFTNVLTHHTIVILGPPIVVPGNPNKVGEGVVEEVAA